MEEKLLTPEQVCAALKVSIQTLRLWDKSGKLSALRTPGGHRRDKKCDIYKFIDIDKPGEDREESVALYSRVSSAQQKTKGDLDRPNTRLTESAVLPKSYEAELIEDMLSLMASFSAKIYGKRSTERKKNK